MLVNAWEKFISSDLPTCMHAAECQIRAREALARRTACGAEGYRSPGSCPLGLRLHGGCGGSRLQVASALRSQGSVTGFEVWWGSAHDYVLDVAELPPIAAAAVLSAAEAGGGEAGHVLLAMRLTMTDGTKHVSGNLRRSLTMTRKTDSADGDVLCSSAFLHLNSFV